MAVSRPSAGITQIRLAGRPVLAGPLSQATPSSRCVFAHSVRLAPRRTGGQSRLGLALATWNLPIASGRLPPDDAPVERSLADVPDDGPKHKRRGVDAQAYPTCRLPNSCMYRKERSPPCMAAWKRWRSDWLMPSHPSGECDPRRQPRCALLVHPRVSSPQAHGRDLNRHRLAASRTDSRCAQFSETPWCGEPQVERDVHQRAVCVLDNRAELDKLDIKRHTRLPSRRSMEAAPMCSR